MVLPGNWAGGFPRLGNWPVACRPLSPARRGALLWHPLGGNRWGMEHLFYAGDNLEGLAGGCRPFAG